LRRSSSQPLTWRRCSRVYLFGVIAGVVASEQDPVGCVKPSLGYQTSLVSPETKEIPLCDPADADSDPADADNMRRNSSSLGI
jgi:hypothetical protein